MTDLYLIRHSHTESNGFHLLSGIEECELTAFGKRQIDALVKKFRDKRIDALYSSDLLRARLMADAIGRSHRIPTKTDRRLREVNMGIWESNFIANIIWEQPDRYDCFANNSEEFRLDGFPVSVWRRSTAAKAVSYRPWAVPATNTGAWGAVNCTPSRGQ